MATDYRLLAARFLPPVDRRLLHHALPLGAAAVVYVGYLLTHPYPAYGGGLFLETAEQIAKNGYRLPAQIPGYTAGGIPFGYPPLAFYIVALLIDVGGLDPIAVTRFLPGLVVIAYLLPFRGLAGELTATPRQATLATLLMATAPPVLKWHLSAGGIVRAVAFLFALTSLYAGVRLFRTHATRWLAAATVTFGLVVLTHPTYAVFVVVSYLVAYVALDRSVRGLLSGAIVGFGGLVVATPWLAHVAAVHGIGIFSTASGTHGGIGVGPATLWAYLTVPLVQGGVHTPFYVLVYLGGLYALWRRRWFLPAWLLAVAVAVPKRRFLFVPGALLAAVLVYEVVVPPVSDRVATPGGRRVVPTAMAGLVALAAVTAGTLFGAGLVSGAAGLGPAQPQFMDAADHDAMEWAERNTPPDATFVALGGAAEWFPFVADRTILVGPWGVEWKDTEGYYVEFERFATISACRDAACIDRSLAAADVSPDYVYVPTDRYTVFDEAHAQAPSMPSSLEEADRFRVVFENEGVVIAAVVDDGSAPGPDQPRDLDERQRQDREDAED